MGCAALSTKTMASATSYRRVIEVEMLNALSGVWPIPSTYETAFNELKAARDFIENSLNDVPKFVLLAQAILEKFLKRVLVSLPVLETSNFFDEQLFGALCERDNFLDVSFKLGCHLLLGCGIDCKLALFPLSVVLKVVISIFVSERLGIVTKNVVQSEPLLRMKEKLFRDVLLASGS